MRWYTGVALALFVVVTFTSGIRTRKAERVAPTAIEKPLGSEPLAARERARPAALLTALQPLQPRQQLDRGGVAHIKGRVIFPPGEEGATSHVYVSADDGTREFQGQVTEDGRFALHLPPGRYTLDAAVEEWVGTAPDVLAAAGSEREVDIRLGPGVAIRGTLHGPKNATVSVFVKPSSGSAESESEGRAVGGSFEFEGLVPGRKYDLTFGGPEVRKVILQEVVAPASGLQVTLDALAVVRGAIGFPRGERCPIASVILKLPDGGDSDRSYEPDADCRFQLAVPEDVFKVTLVATGTGWFLEQTVDIPANGDPPPVCLNPPCRENPTEGLARLRVMLQGARAGSDMRAWAIATDGTHRRFCDGEQGWCEIGDLPVGEPLQVGGTDDDGCSVKPQTAVLVSGENLLRFSCRYYRRVAGVIRTVAGALPAKGFVRCSGEPKRMQACARLFEIDCPSEDSSLEYQVERNAPWRSIPLPSGTDSPFVEITL